MTVARGHTLGDLIVECPVLMLKPRKQGPGPSCSPGAGVSVTRFGTCWKGSKEMVTDWEGACFSVPFRLQMLSREGGLSLVSSCSHHFDDFCCSFSLKKKKKTYFCFNLCVCTTEAPPPPFEQAAVSRLALTSLYQVGFELVVVIFLLFLLSARPSC